MPTDPPPPSIPAAFPAGMMIEALGLGKRFGRQTIFRDLSFTLQAGEALGVTGPNGAGKTTLLQIVAGYLTPSGGALRVGGRDVWEDPLAARRLTGYLPESAALYPEMRVREYLIFRGRLKGLQGARLTQRLEAVEAACALAAVGRRIVGQLSLGYRRRVGLADALLAEPPLLVLDEPTLGLDPEQTAATQELIRAVAGRQAVLLASNQPALITATCDRVLTLSAL